MSWFEIIKVKGKQNFPCLKLMSAEKVENDRRAMREGLTCDKGQCQERVNKNGKEIVPFIYDDMSFFYDELSRVRNKYGEYGFIDIDGKVVIPLIYEGIYFLWRDGFTRVRKYGKYGFINKKGVSLYPPPDF